MSGVFGVVSNNNCISSLYYGTDYHSHLGTEYGGIAFIGEKGIPVKKIHDISRNRRHRLAERRRLHHIHCGSISGETQEIR